MLETLSLASHGPVIPVIVVQRLEDAVPLAEALVAGGVKVLEVTLRTPVALQAMEAMAKVPGAIASPNAGFTYYTLTSCADLAAAAPGLADIPAGYTVIDTGTTVLTSGVASAGCAVQGPGATPVTFAFNAYGA